MTNLLINRFKKCRSASAAVEFAMIAPVFLLLLFGTIVFGTYIAVINEVQELAAEAVRASIAGVSDAERASLAQQALVAEVSTYPFVNPSHISIVSATTDPVTQIFSVTLSYDASGLFVFSMPFVPMPNKSIVRSASIQRGGL